MMINKFLLLVAVCVFRLSLVAEERPLLEGWEFRRDGAWQAVRIPHDWAIDGAFDPSNDVQFTKIDQDGEIVERQHLGRTAGLPWTGVGWYRRTVELEPGTRSAELVFDGAMAHPTVYSDGVKIGEWRFGYAPFVVKLPVRPKQVVSVRLENLPQSSRWYPGAGLFRPVVLRTDPACRAEEVFVRTERLENGVAHLRVTGPAGERTFTVKDPVLWTPETPHLYTLEPEGIRYGIRTVGWTNGVFELNGRRRDFRGVCLHHDLGPLGAAFNRSAFRRQVRLLKEMGCDAIRTAHNIPCSWQMDICDEEGMMVMAESFDEWRDVKCRNGYHLAFDDWWRRDLEALVRFHRNHPSVVMWSIGNEIPDQVHADGTRLSAEMRDFIRALDPTRPVTQGHSYMPQAIDAGGPQEMDIPGVTYRLPFYGALRKVSRYGGVLGAETASTVSSRGVYKFPAEPTKDRQWEDGQCSSYDLGACSWSNLPDDDWAMQDDHDWALGEFVWTGFDYLGEPTPYKTYWPSRSAYFGIFDLAGLPKDRFWLYRSRWRADSPTLHLLPHWTWPGREGQVTPVYCYTSYPEAELFVNGISQGRRKKDPASRLDRYRLRWNDVVYSPGELRVVAYDAAGRRVGEKTVRTAGAPHHLELSADRTTLAPPSAADTPDLAFVTVRIVDREGNLCPDAALPVSFSSAGAVRYARACNGDATSLEPFRSTTMRAFHGQLVAVVEPVAAGEGRLLATAPGLPVASADVGVWRQERDGRVVTDLSGTGWTLTEADGTRRAVSVPHSWNVEDGCDGKEVLSSERYAKNASCMNSYERKRVVYSRALPDAEPGRRYFVRCEGASITAVVSVNGKRLGEHLGAFTAFCFEATEAIKPTGNRLEIAVDNFSRDDVAPPVNADFTMYGGLYRGVELIETPQVCIDPVTDGASGVRLFPDPDTGRVRAEIRVLGGKAETREFAVPDFRLWSPETPVVYTQRFEIASGDAVTETFGFRRAEFRADGFYLNGVKRFVRGVNYHQDREGRGWAVAKDEIAADIGLIRELGADGLRTAHYPHSGFTYSCCDERGLVVWCEQPNVNGLRFTDEFRRRCWRQTREMVMQLGNHPSIVCWSIFNELYNKVPMTEGEPEAMMEELRDDVRALDPSRRVAAAGSFPDKRRLNDVPEVLGFNRYPGWYGLAGNTMAQMIDEICVKNGRTTFGMTEYGAGGSPNQHGDARTRCDPESSWHTEEYQAYVHANGYRDLRADPRVWGSFVWCMFDYGSDRRLEGEFWGRNDKGLMTFDHRVRKDAWYLYKANWSDEPTLRLVGTRREGTTNETATVLGFSNVGEVTLAINGRVVGVKTPDAVKTVTWEDVPLAMGRNEVTLTAGGLSSTAVWTRYPAPNYDPAKIGEVRLEDPLVFADGRKVASAADWTARRREILDLFQREMYGRMPGPIAPVVDLIDEGVTMGGYATRRLFRMYFREDRTGPCVNWLLLLPRQEKGKVPTLLFLNYGGNHELLDDSVIPVPTCWMRPAPGFRRYGEKATAATRGLYADPNLRTTYPVGMILACGFAVMTACYAEVSPDWHGRKLDGRYRADDVLSLFPFDASRTDNTTALGAWAWALCRGMDLLERERAVDAKRVTVCGSSRLAKTALLAGAFDERFFAVVPNQTGGGGCPLLKRNFGENAESLLRNFPHWFCAAFAKYADNEKAMPFDSHLLMACVAPRKLLVEGFGDPFYDTEGEYLAAKAASPAWTFLGATGLPDVAFPQPYDTVAIGPRLGYVRRTEKHGLSAIDWTWIMDFSEK